MFDRLNLASRVGGRDGPCKTLPFTQFNHVVKYGFSMSYHVGVCWRLKHSVHSWSRPLKCGVYSTVKAGLFPMFTMPNLVTLGQYVRVQVGPPRQVSAAVLLVTRSSPHGLRIWCAHTRRAITQSPKEFCSFLTITESYYVNTKFYALANIELVANLGRFIALASADNITLFVMTISSFLTLSEISIPDSEYTVSVNTYESQ